MGLLTAVDVAALAAYAEAYGRWRVATEAIAAMAVRDEVTRGLLDQVQGRRGDGQSFDLDCQQRGENHAAGGG